MTHDRWPRDRINAWYADQPWLVGCNFIPSTAVNQLEMWQADTFDPETIDRELGWAADLGMNTVRVYLHDLAWETDPKGFIHRIDKFLELAAAHGIRTLFVIFDDCWYPNPQAGPQPDPTPGVHNSAWLQSPGYDAAVDLRQRRRLQAYVQDIVGTFGRDDRVLVWDIYNEIGNVFLPSLSLPWYLKFWKIPYLFFRHMLLPIRTLPLLEDAFRWVREIHPDQPLTVGVWFVNERLNRTLLRLSDIISFHNYNPVPNLEKQIEKLRLHGRPLLCTEYLARNMKCRFETHLPIFKREKVGCYNWGLVSGKTQTIFSWQDRGGGAEPTVWYHDILRGDGTPFDNTEVGFIRRMTEGTG